VVSLAGCRRDKTSFACRFHHDTIPHDSAIPCPHIVTNPDLQPEARSRPDLHPEIRPRHDDKAGRADPPPMGYDKSYLLTWTDFSRFSQWP